jgi:hypothetical protein
MVSFAHRTPLSRQVQLVAEICYPVPGDVDSLGKLTEWLETLRVPQRDWRVDEASCGIAEFADYAVFRTDDPAAATATWRALINKLAWSLHGKISRAGGAVVWRNRPEAVEEEYSPVIAAGVQHAGRTAEFPDMDFVTDTPVVIDRGWKIAKVYYRCGFE